MRLDTDGVWSVSRDHLRILRMVEQLTDTRDYIPIDTLRSHSGSRPGSRGAFDSLALDLARMKFLTYRDGAYKLSLSGHDCLAINALRGRGLDAMGAPIGIGKESDIYNGVYRGHRVAIKVHRLGRTSYQRVHERRLASTDNWFARNRENCEREAHFLQSLAGMEVPRLYDRERHMLVMELSEWRPLYQVTVDRPQAVSGKMLGFIRRLWERGYVHGDFNEFNVLVGGTDDILVIDFPQCIAATDPRAVDYLRRDLECVRKYFKKKNFYECDMTSFSDITG